MRHQPVRRHRVRGWGGSRHECPDSLKPLIGGELPSQLGMSRIKSEHGLKLAVPDREQEYGETHRTCCTPRDQGMRPQPVNDSRLEARARPPGDMHMAPSTRPDPHGLRCQDNLRSSPATDGDGRTPQQRPEQHEDRQLERPRAAGKGHAGEGLQPHGDQRAQRRHGRRQVVAQADAARGPELNAPGSLTPIAGGLRDPATQRGPARPVPGGTQASQNEHHPQRHLRTGEA